NSAKARDLLGMSALYDVDDIELDDTTEELLSDYDLDSLFDDADDFSARELASAKENDAKSDKKETENKTLETSPASETSWNFIVCDVENNKDIDKLIKKMNKHFKHNDWNIEAVNWRSAAGSTAMYLYFLRLILNIGIIVVLFAGFIIINNTLVVNILDRIQEIGTMRAIGTTKLFVSLQCMAETLILAVTAGLIGLILGCILSQIVLSMHITFSNNFLIQLFGGNTLVTVVKASNLFNCFCVSLLLGMVAWIYPVHTALNTSPVTAMTGAK
ncbi:MAG: FtsX-like permease family protein, partial [Treponema sp.]|nr:FtsX-like permease family protein [Treponema sp.]